MNAVIQFDPSERQSRRREAGTFTLTENRVVEYQKRNGAAAPRVLTTLSERANFTHKSPAMSVAEIQVETGLGERGVQKALVQLAAQGFAFQVGKLWQYGAANGDANENANGCSQTRSENSTKNAVLDSKKQALKEVEGSRRYKDKTFVVSKPATLPPDAQPVTAHAAVRAPQESETLSASTGSEFEPIQQGRQTSNAHGGKQVAARRPGAAALLLEVWNAHRGVLPAADSITPGREKAAVRLMQVAGSLEAACALLADAAREVAADPFWQDRRYGLDNLMPGKVVAKAEAQRARKLPSVPTASTAGAELERFAPGMRVRYPDGSEALVVSVQARSISTDHPQVRDVPLSQCRNLEVLA